MASNNGCYRIGKLDIMGSSILPISTIYPAFHLRETWRARGMDVVNDFGTRQIIRSLPSCTQPTPPYPFSKANPIQIPRHDLRSNQPYHNLTDGISECWSIYSARRSRTQSVSTPKVPALRPRNTRTQRQIFQAAAGTPMKAIGTAFVKMAFGLSAFGRLPQGTAEALTTDRQQGHIDLRRRTQKVYRRTGEAVLTASIDEALRCLSTHTRRLQPKSLTGLRIKYTFSHALHESVDDAEWARVSGVQTILGYRFKDRSLLVVALRPKGGAHARGVRTNDSLEYHGDSVLELVVALFWLLEGRQAIGNITKRSVSNLAFQAVRLRWGLDRLLIGLQANSMVKVAQARAQYEATIQGDPTEPYWEQAPCCLLAEGLGKLKKDTQNDRQHYIPASLFM
ncbi:MAG: hypothetical protein J3Q66DRAFT_444876 [Benniella sp.]|nr:MAG: hypothetical protein J3Q66DRAFT_444876 [Benniella sp.]